MGYRQGSICCVDALQPPYGPSVEGSSPNLVEDVNATFDRLQDLLEKERSRLLSLLAQNDQPKPHLASSPEIEATMAVVRSSLQFRRASRSTEDIKILEPSSNALRILSQIVKRQGILCDVGRSGYPRHRKGLAILALLADKADTQDRVSLQELQDATGYKQPTLKAEISRKLPELLSDTGWRLIGNERTGWRLVCTEQ